jgi:pyruvate/2-oxoglutarate dehydrogenase complex dihydrolipoamide acyltransferase (E2) component
MSDNDRYEYRSAPRIFNILRKVIEREIAPTNVVTLLQEVDLTEIERIRHLAGPHRPSYTAFVVKALAMALRDFPYANRRLSARFLRGHALQTFRHVDVGVAVERDVPGCEAVAFIDVARDADQMPLDALTDWLRKLRDCDTSNNEQWRAFHRLLTKTPIWLATLLLRLPLFSPLAWDRYRGGAAMVSSPAKYGADAVVTSWTAPIGVSFGLVKERPVARDGHVVVARTFTVSLSFDRRLMAGAQAARFFHRIVERLEHASLALAHGVRLARARRPDAA